jgi:hypothetical protein
MAGKHARAGGKFSGSHTSLIPAAAMLADLAQAQPEVTKIAPGFIKAGLRPTKGQRRVKISVRSGNLLLAVRDNTSHQELTIYTSAPERTIEGLTAALEGHPIALTVAREKD